MNYSLNFDVKSLSNVTVDFREECTLESRIGSWATDVRLSLQGVVPYGGYRFWLDDAPIANGDASDALQQVFIEQDEAMSRAAPNYYMRSEEPQRSRDGRPFSDMPPWESLRHTPWG